MNVMKLASLDTRTTRTEQDGATATFCAQVLGLGATHHEEGCWVFKLPDGARVEVFGPGVSVRRALHHRTGRGLPCR